ncbi:hypothetical protein PTTG_28870 [Puccinia triticina 1-1 BBBD Race 1]|uniref:Uncharacterized protein n=1 Tax=Puccinia triticina (isolate 1-1 / race 1 (BBBD)) TaxID=630390 RepID=A0A180G8T5_PUCT1|nr:hypothetical protein PTTG_28870 [Puccinia triticina 1-1 BBBD Race 1]
MTTLHHPLSPPSTSTNTPNSLQLARSQHDQLLLDYPPKSPDELSSQSATRHLLSSPAPLSFNTLQKHAPELTTIPLHLPKPKQPSALSQPSSEQLDLLASFSEECRKMFYTGDPTATKNVEYIIKNLPAASKAAYTKQMATVRSQFHRDAASSRRAEVDKLLHDTLPSSIIIKAVGNDSSLWAMRSPRARQERLDRLKKFINAHCVRNMVGAHPFFNSLCAVLHLLSLPARKAGSGKRRVEWEIDLALFCEAGGEPFLVDSIQFLKGVLGFEDHLKPLVASSLRTSFATSTNTCSGEDSEDEDGGMDVVIGHADGDDGMTLEERQEMELDSMLGGGGEGPFADTSTDEGYGQAHVLKGKTTLKARDRALSDPFLDPAPARPPARKLSSPRITVSPPATEEHHSSLGLGYTPPPPLAPSHDHQQPSADLRPHDSAPLHRRSPTQNSLDAPPPTETRIFRSPSYLTVPELRDLISAFPSFIRLRTKPLKFDRAGILDSSSDPDPHRPDNADPAAKRLRQTHPSKLFGQPSASAPAVGAQQSSFHGHGLIRLSVFEKDPGWKGSFLERIKMFFFRFFKL